MARKPRTPKEPSPRFVLAPGVHDNQRLITVALEIAEERNEMLGRIRDLLEAGKDQEAIPLMKEYCGLPRA